ncbi:MAG TPA: hypothetical protein PLU30_16550 [Verrucomicrobiae bacterium]|nr:hypothetical protein [Verrucomicrobiae bacterium]
MLRRPERAFDLAFGAARDRAAFGWDGKAAAMLPHSKTRGVVPDAGKGRQPLERTVRGPQGS